MRLLMLVATAVALAASSHPLAHTEEGVRSERSVCVSSDVVFARQRPTEPSVYLSSSGEARGGRDRSASTLRSLVYGDDGYMRFDGVNDYLGNITTSRCGDVSLYIHLFVRSFVRSFVRRRVHAEARRRQHVLSDKDGQRRGIFHVRSGTTLTMTSGPLGSEWLSLHGDVGRSLERRVVRASRRVAEDDDYEDNDARKK